MTGFIHSLESMGLVDGPGVRAVVFLQGCPLRCLYCHNPDTQTFSGGQETTPEALVKRLLRFRPYFESSGGGVTFSGGEPLGQSDFLLACLKLLKAEGVHTCIDTCGVGQGDYEDILKHTDLVLYDVKHHQREGYRKITGRELDPTPAFVEAVRKANVPMWVRHVVVPGLTDGEDHFTALGEYIATLPGVEKVELLPYHTMGVEKYRKLGIPYALEGVPPMDGTKLEKWNRRLNAICRRGTKQERNGSYEH